jgi:glycosyltransferase involved in cell wall biosynthesis
MTAGRTARPPKPVSESTFAVVANGYFDSPPVGPLTEHLLDRGVPRLTVVIHPLNTDGDPHHEIRHYERGELRRRRQLRLPTRPPYTYPLDLLVPPVVGRVDGWLAFNNLAAARGIAARRLGRAGRVLYWAIDFVPDRFGASPLSRAYDALDRFACRHADARIDLSQPALEGREARLGLGPGDAPGAVLPIGAWVDRVPVADESAAARRKLVFSGHLVERQGVGMLLEALAELRRRGVAFEAAIGGRGPLEAQLREQADRLGLNGSVQFTGFFEDHRDVDRLLASSSIAVAPYDPSDGTFSQYADPGKLKSYLAAGLPIVMTGVPPNAGMLADRGAATVVPFDAVAMADALAGLLESEERWRAAHRAALDVAREFDWARVFDDALRLTGFAV